MAKIGRPRKDATPGATVQIDAAEVERKELITFNLSPAEELFAQAMARGTTQTNAAIEAGYSIKAAHVIGSKLIRRPKIAARIKQLQQSGISNVEAARADHLLQLVELRELAKGKGQLAAAIKAEELRGKVLGLYGKEVVAAGMGEMGREAIQKRIDESNPEDLRAAITDAVRRFDLLSDMKTIDITVTENDDE